MDDKILAGSQMLQDLENGKVVRSQEFFQKIVQPICVVYGIDRYDEICKLLMQCFVHDDEVRWGLLKKFHEYFIGFVVVKYPDDYFHFLKMVHDLVCVNGFTILGDRANKTFESLPEPKGENFDTRIGSFIIVNHPSKPKCLIFKVWVNDTLMAGVTGPWKLNRNAQIIELAVEYNIKQSYIVNNVEFKTLTQIQAHYSLFLQIAYSRYMRKSNSRVLSRKISYDNNVKNIS